MKRVDLREFNGLSSIFATKADWEELKSNSSYLRMVQSLYSVLEAAYIELVHNCSDHGKTCEVRGRVKALEDILGIVAVSGSDANDDTKEERYAAMDAFVETYENLKET